MSVLDDPGDCPGWVEFGKARSPEEPPAQRSDRDPDSRLWASCRRQVDHRQQACTPDSRRARADRHDRARCRRGDIVGSTGRPSRLPHRLGLGDRPAPQWVLRTGDSVNPLAVTRSAWLQVGARLAVRTVEEEVICSDPGKHRRGPRRGSHRSPVSSCQPDNRSSIASTNRGITRE